MHLNLPIYLHLLVIDLQRWFLVVGPPAKIAAVDSYT